MINIDGSDIKNITSVTVDYADYYPSFSAEGGTICFTSLRDGFSKTYLLNLTDHKLLRLRTDELPEEFPSTAHKNALMVLSSKQNGNYDIIQLTFNRKLP